MSEQDETINTEMTDKQAETLVGPPKAVVLLSGGLDSATALADAKNRGYEVYPLTIKYGQRHACELDAARAVAAQLEVPFGNHLVLHMPLSLVAISALTSDIEVPKEGTTGEAIPVTYVPGRNIIFLSVAASYAESIGALAIFCGVNAVDYSGYPDCRQEFITAFEKALAVGTKTGVEGNPITIFTPLIGLTKAEIIKLGNKLGLDYDHTHSCYDPVKVSGDKPYEVTAWYHCGKCDSCRIRKAGFEEAGVNDPTLYAN